MSTSMHAGRALIVSITDHTLHGEDDGGAGALVTELLAEAGFVVDGSVAVPSDEVAIRTALNTAVIGGVDLVVTIGGTGVSPRDVTPDVTAEVIDRELPGIAQALRWSGMAAGVVDAVVSRGLVGVSGSTLVANLAGSRAAIRDGMATSESVGHPRDRATVRPGGLTAAPGQSAALHRWCAITGLTGRAVRRSEDAVPSAHRRCPRP